MILQMLLLWLPCPNGVSQGAQRLWHCRLQDRLAGDTNALLGTSRISIATLLSFCDINHRQNRQQHLAAARSRP